MLMVNKLSLVAMLLVAGFAHNASAGWVNSIPIQGSASCGPGTITQIGYFDPGTGLRTGDSGYIHIVAQAGCAFDTVGFDVFLPSTVTTAVSTQNPVYCFRGAAGQNGTAVPTNSTGGCSQTATTGNFGGLFFGWSNLNPNDWLEIQIPVFWGGASPGQIEAVLTSVIVSLTPVISPPVTYRPQVTNQTATSTDGTSATAHFDVAHFFAQSQVVVEYGVGVFDHVSPAVTLSSQYPFYTGTAITLPNTTPGTALTWRVRITNAFGTFYGAANTIFLPNPLLPVAPSICKVRKCLSWLP